MGSRVSALHCLPLPTWRTGGSLLWTPGGLEWARGRLGRGSAVEQTWALRLPRSGPIKFLEELIPISGSPVVWRASRQGLDLRCVP